MLALSELPIYCRQLEHLCSKMRADDFICEGQSSCSVRSENAWPLEILATFLQVVHKIGHVLTRRPGGIDSTLCVYVSVCG